MGRAGAVRRRSRGDADGRTIRRSVRRAGAPPVSISARPLWTSSRACSGLRPSRSTNSRAAAELDVAQVRMAIIELELAGRIERSGGDRVALLIPDSDD